MSNWEQLKQRAAAPSPTMKGRIRVVDAPATPESPPPEGRLISAEGTDVAHGSPDRKQKFGKTTAFTNAGWAMSEGDHGMLVSVVSAFGDIIPAPPESSSPTLAQSIPGIRSENTSGSGTRLLSACLA